MYTDIRDELEDFRDFIQDICCDIDGAVCEMEDQLDTLCGLLSSYNEAAERYVFLSGCLRSAHAPADAAGPTGFEKRTEEERLPFPLTDSQEVL